MYEQCRGSYAKSIQTNRNYIIIKKWVTEDCQEELFLHTKRIRENKATQTSRSQTEVKQEAPLLSAFKAIKGGQYASAAAGARAFNVPVSALKHRIKGRQFWNESRPSGHKYTVLEEKRILLLNEDGNTGPYSEAISTMLAGVARKLWQQAPIHLPQTLSHRHAWLLAESVRQTIIVCYMLRSAYSLNTRKYSVRTPFVDSLPLDLRNNLWDDDTPPSLEHALSDSNASMVSLHEWSDGMPEGRVHNVSHFSELILAACKEQAVSTIPSPPLDTYIDEFGLR
ncbi:hypothetical protein N7520_003892 [Penicillium odoratum]|uniref:uncharacterized protein n=1 Tax=Penicillium odoratum TaxID=1167516 RepID=UPI002546D9AF|nr:uncharacterized protein N7520_003892 [Penicillium odoratum]KAJ5769333.1 hypothetical protein N7520_003892 [Penicillium odoratum]